jgi:pyrroline-5-carboxylate reductase
MGEALVGGLLQQGRPVSSIVVSEIVDDRRAELESIHGVATCAEPIRSESALIAVKPQHVAAAAADIGSAGTERVLSVAAGVPTGVIESALGGEIPVVRAMPNTPALVGRGAAAIAPGRHAGAADLEWAADLLGAVGIVEVVTESALDAVTGLSGSGPAYIFLVAEAMIDAGVLNGLTRPTAEALAIQTIVGSGELMAQPGSETAAQLRANVTSPGGTTAAGLRVLEAAAVRAAFLDAVTAAADRSRELGS